MEPGGKDLILNQARALYVFLVSGNHLTLARLEKEKVCPLNQPQAVYATVAMSLFQSERKRVASLSAQSSLLLQWRVATEIDI